MNDPVTARLRPERRSMGLKLLVVGALALLMTIPALFVYGIINDREARAKEVSKELGGLFGGQQTILGPALLVPSSDAVEHAWIFYPVTGNALIQTTTQERQRSLFRVPVYQSKIEFNAKFDLAGATAEGEDAAGLDWAKAQFIIGVANVRGGSDEPVLTMANQTLPFAPLGAQGVANAIGGLTLLSVDAGPNVKPDAKFDLNISLRLNGAERLAIPPFAKSTKIEMRGDWPNPGFGGAFLPMKRTIGKGGFDARWYVPFIARGVAASGNMESLEGLEQSAVTVSFVDVASPYQSVTRSVKYALLFLALIFLAYFSFEVATGKRVHPAQYTLVGIAQVIFYLLLLSISERLGFDTGFAIAAIATIALISWYAGSVFGGSKYGLRAAGVFAIVYLLVYLLLTLEDESLLLGSMVSFLAVAVVMYMTRNLDWYSSMPVKLTDPNQRSQPIIPDQT